MNAFSLIHFHNNILGDCFSAPNGSCPPNTEACEPTPIEAYFLDPSFPLRVDELIAAGFSAEEAVSEALRERCDAVGNPLTATADWININGGNEDFYRCWVDFPSLNTPPIP